METQVSRVPLQRLSEDSPYRSIVTLKNNTGRSDDRLLPKTMLHANLWEQKHQKSAPGFPLLWSRWPIDSAGRGGAGRSGSKVIDSPRRRGRKGGESGLGILNNHGQRRGSSSQSAREGGPGPSGCRERRPPRPLEPCPSSRQQRTRRRSPGSVRRAGSLGARPRECRRRSLRRPPARRAPRVPPPPLRKGPPAASILVTAGRPKRGGGMARAAPSGGGPQ